MDQNRRPSQSSKNFWQGVLGQNGWGAATFNPNSSEFHISLNHPSDTTATVISAFLGTHEGANNGNPRAVAFPVSISGSTNLGVTGVRAPFDSSWHLVTVTIVKTSTDFTVATYFNGQFIEQGVGTQNDISLWNPTLFLGKNGVSGNRNFWGKMKKFVLFNKALTPNEIEALYKVQSQP